MLRIRLVLFVALCIAAAAGLPAPAGATAGESEIEAMVLELIHLIGDNYVIPERVPAIEARLRAGLESGDYQSYTDLLELSKRVTSDLREASGDLHFGIRPKPPESPPASSPPTESDAENGAPRKPSATPSPVTGLGRIETLDGNIGYIEIKSFPDPAVGGSAVDAAFTQLAESSALILDLRTSRGGHPGMVAYLLSYFFDGEPLMFNRLHWPNSGKTIEFETVEDLPAPRYPGRSVYLLTSTFTPSAAEGFSYHMKHLGRATLIGQPTAGAAHLNQGFELPGFRVLIPTGRPLSPVTNANWEGVGVIPHHEVAVDEALSRALELATSTRGNEIGSEPSTKP